jgi:hypothetical protein
VGGLALGKSIPFAPGGAGVAAATMAVAVAFHAFETGAGLAFGIGGWLQLKVGRSPRIRVGLPTRAETFA